MKAAVVDRQGGIPEYRDVPDPQVNDGEVLVTVAAVAVENVDRAIVAGKVPVDVGVQSSGYGFRTHLIHGDKRFHAGLDIATLEGREIRAVQRGTVTYAQRHPGYGNMVEITHPDGVVTRYAHASRLHVRVVSSGLNCGGGSDTRIQPRIHVNALMPSRT